MSGSEPVNAGYSSRHGFGWHAVSVLRAQRVRLSDGVHLSINLWLPFEYNPNENDFGLRPDSFELLYRPAAAAAAGHRHFGCVLESVPYRKDDWTAARDHQRHPWMASQGFAVVRSDQRGSGASEGVYSDEYEPQEQADIVELIGWISRQTWSGATAGWECTARAGAASTDYRLHNNDKKCIERKNYHYAFLSVAYCQPEALKAVISLYSTDDRYNTDIYYEGGDVLLNGAPMWSHQMMLWNAQPPSRQAFDSDTAWRRAWLLRLANHDGSWLRHKLIHHADDAYWQHGNINQDYDRVRAACLVIGGLVDGYTDAAFRMAARLNERSRVVVGPWSHDWPDSATPGPNVDFLNLCLAWWRRWLDDDEDSHHNDPVDQWPRVQVFQRGAHPPAANYATLPGTFISLPDWPSRQLTYEAVLNAVRFPEEVKEHRVSDVLVGTIESSNNVLRLAAPESITGQTDRKRDRLDFVECHPSACQGLSLGEWCAFSGAEWSTNQRRADEHSTCCQTAPLVADIRLCGQVVLYVAVNRLQHDSRGITVGTTTVRVCDVIDDERSTLVTLGHSNFASSRPVWSDERLVVYRVRCRYTTYDMPRGRRLRLALSPQAFPTVLPKGITQSLHVCLAHSWLLLPCLPAGVSGSGVCPALLRAPLPLLPVPTTKDHIKSHIVPPQPAADEPDAEKSSCQPRLLVDDHSAYTWRGVDVSEDKQYVYAISDDCTRARVTIDGQYSHRNRSAPAFAVDTRSRCELTVEPDRFVGHETLRVQIEGDAEPLYDKHWRYVVHR